MTPDLEVEVLAAYGNDGTMAVDVLNTYRPGEQDEGAERVQRAVLVLANGDLSRLRRFTEQARRDYRDVLAWAEYSPEPDEPRSYKELRERLGLPPDPDHEVD